MTVVWFCYVWLSVCLYVCLPSVKMTIWRQSLVWHILCNGLLKEILELHKRGDLGTEVSQRGAGAEPR